MTLERKDKLNAPDLEKTGSLSNNDLYIYLGYMSGNYLALRESDTIQQHDISNNLISVNQKKIARIDNEYFPSSRTPDKKLYSYCRLFPTGLSSANLYRQGGFKSVRKKNRRF